MEDDWDAWGAPDPVPVKKESTSSSMSTSSDSYTTSNHQNWMQNSVGLHQNVTPRGRMPGRGRGRPPAESSGYVPWGTGDSGNGNLGEADDWWTGGSDNSSQQNMSTLVGNTLTIFIPVSETGRVIGRQGATIKDIQTHSGARVNIGRDPVNGETKVEISGSEDQRDKAVDKIQRITGIAGLQKSAKQMKQDEPKEEEPKKVFVDWGAAIRESEEATKKKWAALPDVVRNFYQEDPSVTSMTEEEIAQFREDNFNITIKHFSGSDTRKLPNPTPHFKQAFHNFPEILHEIERNGFVKPSPIQAQSWPVLLQGIDLIGIAQTGTGKTLAYLLPALIHIEGQTTPRHQRPGPTALILAPTRELAQQIEKETQKYLYHGIRSICIYGGGSRRDQCDKAGAGVEIVIATPGRLDDLCQSNVIDLTSVSYLVLDEADRMLDMGFEPQIKKILLDIRPDRQTVMMSATWPEKVRLLAVKYMNDPFQIYVNTLDLAAVHSVTQKIVFLDNSEKKDYLVNFISEMGPEDKVIVFVGRKMFADEVSSDLALKEIDAQCIHGDRDQSDREQAIEDLKTGSVKILIATDVAARGLDIDDITHILNLDFPRNMEEYVHRIGRTGRAGRTGTSISIVTREDWKNAEELCKILKDADQEVPQELIRMATRFQEFQKKRQEEEAVYGRGGRGGRFNRRDDDFSCGSFGGGRSRSRW